MWVKGQIVHEFDDATGGVKDLLDRTNQPHLFDRSYWFAMLWAHNKIGKRPVIARSWGDGTRAWLFLSDLGNGRVTALANYYTLAFRPIFTGSPNLQTKRALLIASARRLRTRPSRFAQICIGPVPNDDGSADLLEYSFRKAGWLTSREPQAISWTINVSGKTFDQFWADRPGALRSTYARKANKSAVTTEIQTHFDAAIWAEYESVYADSWKPDEGSSAFLCAVAQREGETDALRLGIARLDGVAIAAQLWTIEPGRAIIHKLAYRTSAAQHSPGTILTAAMFRYAIDIDHIALIDYGTGDDRYKADWMDTRTELEKITCLNPIYARSWGLAARNWLKRLARAKPHA